MEALNDDNVEYLRPIVPQVEVVWHGLRVLVTNTRMTASQIYAMLEKQEQETNGSPPAA